MSLFTQSDSNQVPRKYQLQPEQFAQAFFLRGPRVGSNRQSREFGKIKARGLLIPSMIRHTVTSLGHLRANDSLPFRKLSMHYKYEDISRMLDHSLLKPTSTFEDFETGCRMAVAYQTGSVCIQPHYLKRCAEILKGSGVKASTVIGFLMAATARRSRLPKQSRPWPMAAKNLISSATSVEFSAATGRMSPRI